MPLENDGFCTCKYLGILNTNLILLLEYLMTVSITLNPNYVNPVSHLHILLLF